jgi:hypothetical protein
VGRCSAFWFVERSRQSYRNLLGGRPEPGTERAGAAECYFREQLVCRAMQLLRLRFQCTERFCIGSRQLFCAGNDTADFTRIIVAWDQETRSCLASPLSRRARAI